LAESLLARYVANDQNSPLFDDARALNHFLKARGIARTTRWRRAEELVDHKVLVKRKDGSFVAGEVLLQSKTGKATKTTPEPEMLHDPGDGKGPFMSSPQRSKLVN